MNRNRRNQRGVALLLAIFALCVVTSIGLGMMYLSDSETAVNSNFRDEQTAYYAARAGLEEARDRMRSTSGTGITISANLPSARPGAVGGVLYILNPANSETVAPWTTTNAYFDDEICKEVNCGGAQVPPTSGWYVNPALTSSSAYAASPVLTYKWMRVTLKTNQSAAGNLNVMYVNGSSAPTTLNYYVCWNGLHEIVSSIVCASPNDPVYLLTALAVTPSGTHRMLQYEMTQDSLNLSLPAAVTLDGASDVMSGPDSRPYDVSGSDHAGCGAAAGAGTVPAIGVSDNADITNVTGGIPSRRLGNYTGTAGHATPDVENVFTSMSTSLQSVTALQSLVTTVENNANQTLNGTATPITSIANPGTLASPQIIVVNGDLSLSGMVTGYGILLVTGTYKSSGTVGWNGIVLVIGKGIVINSGGGTNQYNGGMIVAQTINPTNGQPLSALGTPTFNWGGGGGNGVYYSSGCISQASTLPYLVVAKHELLY